MIALSGTMRRVAVPWVRVGPHPWPLSHDGTRLRERKALVPLGACWQGSVSGR